jgi:hypothetical protein
MAMRFKTQRRWAVVHNFSGHIDHSTIAFNRRDVVGAIVSVWRNYSWFTTKHRCQSDATFWRASLRHSRSIHSALRLCGKTNTLAHRVAHLIVNGADPRPSKVTMLATGCIIQGCHKHH